MTDKIIQAENQIECWIPVKIKGRTTFHKPTGFISPTKECSKWQVLREDEGYEYVSTSYGLPRK